MVFEGESEHVGFLVHYDCGGPFELQVDVADCEVQVVQSPLRQHSYLTENEQQRQK
jgi:hypothetical protein